MPRYSAKDNNLPEKHRVFLNGEDITDCSCECDTDEGWAMVYPHERQADGGVRLLDCTDSGWVSVRKRHGTVEIRRTPDTFGDNNPPLTLSDIAGN